MYGAPCDHCSRKKRDNKYQIFCLCRNVAFLKNYYSNGRFTSPCTGYNGFVFVPVAQSFWFLSFLIHFCLGWAAQSSHLSMIHNHFVCPCYTALLSIPALQSFCSPLLYNHFVGSNFTIILSAPTVQSFFFRQY